MKKLLVLFSFFALLIFFAGCQSETPLSPDDQEISLDKGRSVKFTADLVPSTTNPGFVQITLNWDALKGATGYWVTYYNLKLGTLHTFELESTKTYFVIDGLDGEDLVGSYAMMQLSGYECQITIEAKKVRKGEPVTFASGTQTLTWTGTSLAEITINGSIAPTPDNLSTQFTISSWTNTSGYYCFYATWSQYTLFTEAFCPVFVGNSPGQLYSGRSLINFPDDFYTVIGYGYDNTLPGNPLNAIGYAKFTYNP